MRLSACLARSARRRRGAAAASAVPPSGARVTGNNLALPNAETLLGELHLISATTITKDRSRPVGDRTSGVRSHLAEAGRLTESIGETRTFHLNFGPTNVKIHRISLNADSGITATLSPREPMSFSRSSTPLAGRQPSTPIWDGHSPTSADRNRLPPNGFCKPS
ncbi:hypothetical protein ABZ379_05620 [Streptomyces canus]|uniref:hypothetical protein n=1 Tax=Streptomyces canus TaxID=58343 RepID=UPI0033D2F9BA